MRIVVIAPQNKAWVINRIYNSCFLGLHGCYEIHLVLLYYPFNGSIMNFHILVDLFL